MPDPMQKSASRRSQPSPEPQRQNPFAAIPDPETVYSMPLTAPLLGPPPGRFKDGETITSQYRTDFAALSAIVPRPLEPLTTRSWSKYRDGGTSPDSDKYVRMNIMVAARFRRKGQDIVGASSPTFSSTTTAQWPADVNFTASRSALGRSTWKCGAT